MPDPDFLSQDSLFSAPQRRATPPRGARNDGPPAGGYGPWWDAALERGDRQSELVIARALFKRHVSPESFLATAVPWMEAWSVPAMRMILDAASLGVPEIVPYRDTAHEWLVEAAIRGIDGASAYLLEELRLCHMNIDMFMRRCVPAMRNHNEAASRLISMAVERAYVRGQVAYASPRARREVRSAAEWKREADYAPVRFYVTRAMAPDWYEGRPYQGIHEEISAQQACEVLAFGLHNKLITTADFLEDVLWKTYDEDIGARELVQYLFDRELIRPEELVGPPDEHNRRERLRAWKPRREWWDNQPLRWGLKIVFYTSPSDPPEYDSSLE